MTDLTKLSAAKLEALYAKRSDASSVNCNKFIEAGRGMERPAQIRTQTDALSLEYVALNDALCAVVDEMNARKRYHGSLKPIKRPIFA